MSGQGYPEGWKGYSLDHIMPVGIRILAEPAFHQPVAMELSGNLRHSSGLGSFRLLSRESLSELEAH